jgi:predicted MFS family arabinose efflux permease
VNRVLAVTDWRVTYAVLALLFFPIAAFVWRLDLPESVSNERELSAGDLRELLRRPPILGMTVSMALVGGMEGIVSTWFPYFATEFVSRESSNVLLSVFLLSYVPGRAACSWLVGRYDSLGFGILLSVCTLPAFYLLFGGVTAIPLFVRVVVAGFLFSFLFPLISTFGVEAAPEYSGPLNAVATAGAYAGVSICPVIVGVLAERFGIVSAMWFVVALAACLVVSLVATWLTVR